MTRPRRFFLRARAPVWIIVAVVVIAVAVTSTYMLRGAPNGLLVHGNGPYIGSAADLKPDANPGKEKLNYAGTIIPVDTKATVSGPNISLDMMYKGTSLDTEVYRVSSTEFDLVNAAGEEYSPPIPLLRFPMNIGDSWKWTGQMLTGPTGRKCDAIIITQGDKVDMGIPTDALLVEVDLSMYSGASEPALRRLQFWFVKGKGVVKRDFGLSTSRTPDVTGAAAGPAIGER